MSVRRRLSFILFPLALLACAEAAVAATIEVVKSPYCDCCSAWVEYLRREGFDVRVVEAEDVTPAARRAGVPDDLRSCHTATIGGYAIEGHVPVREIERLLREKPAGAVGIAVPGMPIGSPGMDGPAYGGRKDPYDVLLVLRDGTSRVYQAYR